jgi:CRP-like cAMP-binding protein
MKDSPEMRAAIRATGAFRDLSDANIALLIEASELETFEPGAVLMIQGEPSDYAMLILEGEVTVTADSARGVIPVSTLSAPCLLGELGSLAKLPRSATGRARTPVTALRFGRSALVEVARGTPSLLIDIIGRMGEWMRKVNGAISLYAHALSALEQHEFDPALLEELRNPIPDLADFGQTFGRMAEQIILRRQRDDEMASAAIIQRALLPKVPEFAAESGLDICAAMTPANDVGGDFYDLVQLADGRVALGVGDVCGKACRGPCSWASRGRSSASICAARPTCPARFLRLTLTSSTTTRRSCLRRSSTPRSIRAQARSNIAVAATSRRSSGAPAV